MQKLTLRLRHIEDVIRLCGVEHVVDGCVLQVPQKDLELASQSLVKALMIREKYMAMGQQSFPKITARFLQCLEDKEEFQALSEGLNTSDKKILEGMYDPAHLWWRYLYKKLSHQYSLRQVVSWMVYLRTGP